MHAIRLPGSVFQCSARQCLLLLAVQDGNWDDVSGETFLRDMLMTPIEETRWGKQVVSHPAPCRLFDMVHNTAACFPFCSTAPLTTIVPYTEYLRLIVRHTLINQ